MAVISILSGVALSVLVVRGNGATLQDAGGEVPPTPPEASTQISQPQQLSLGYGYSRRGDHIYYGDARIDQAGRDTLEDFGRDLGRRLTLAHDVDAASFVALSEEYSKDKNAVYYKWISPGRFWVVKIPEADPATFEVMDFNLARDARRVWRTDAEIKGADAATARVVHPGWVWKDRRAVYYQFTRLDGADPESFRHLDQGFYRDASHVYWGTTRLEGADVNTFRTFGNDVPCAADARHVWSGDTRLVNVDAESFRILHNHVIADKNGAYVGTRALPILGADSATFQKVAELEAAGCVLFRDAGHEYLFDPHFGEVYTLARTPQSVVVTKPVWFGEAVGPVRHAATVSATWKDGALSEPEVKMQPEFERGPKPTWEVVKMQRMADAIREAMALSEKEPVAATEQGRASPQSQGDN